MNNLMEQIQQMSLEEQAELASLLDKAKEAAKPKSEVKQLGQPFNRQPRDERGKLLTPEEIYDREHPLIPLLKCYGFTETTINGITGEKRTKRWSLKEVDAYNKPIQEAWLAEKRKHFPDAELPPTPVYHTDVSRYDDPHYTHPTF